MRWIKLARLPDPVVSAGPAGWFSRLGLPMQTPRSRAGGRAGAGDPDQLANVFAAGAVAALTDLLIHEGLERVG